MKTYQIHLKLLGSMTQMPDSQKLFGALMYLFSQTYGQDKTTELVQAVKHQKELHLALSNVMPEGYLPTPQDYLIEELSKIQDGNNDLKKVRSYIKKMSYIKACDLHRLLDNPAVWEDVLSYVKLADRKQLRTTINCPPDETSGLGNNLYSVPCTFPLEINHKKPDVRPKEKSISDFYFYLQADCQGLLHDLIHMLNSAVANQQILILGKRASQGFNTYKLCNVIVDEELSKTKQRDCFLSTGMLLPNDIDFAHSWLKLFTSERRPFEMVGGWHQQATKYFISFISEGSVITAPNSFKLAGRSLPSPYNKAQNIVFGNAFLYPITIPKRRTKNAENAI